MMHSDSEQRAIDILNAIHANTILPQQTLREDNTHRRKNRYLRWKTSNIKKNRWVSCCRCFTLQKRPTANI